MSFAEGIVCPQASRMCCDTPPFFERTFPSPVFVSSCAEVTAAMKGSIGEKEFS